MDEVGRGRRDGRTVSRTWLGTMGVGCGVLRGTCNCVQSIHSNIHTCPFDTPPKSFPLMPLLTNA